MQDRRVKTQLKLGTTGETMIKKLWSGIKKANPWLAGIVAVLALTQEDYGVAIVCLLFLVLLVLSDIHDALRGKA